MKPITIKGNGGAGGATGLAGSRRARVRAIRGIIRRQAAARRGGATPSPRGRP